MNYYNEFDSATAAWLRELIKAGHLPAGDVDERSIEDVLPGDLAGYTQCHFFAGIGGWPLALALAGWPADRPVWTGSCPCQPFSAAGKGAGFDDQRHLWPAWFHLIRECRPAAIFGEQVASKAAEPWIDLVHADLEGVGYAFGCVPFPAAGVGAPHIRDRTYWVADTSRSGLQEQRRRWVEPQGPAEGDAAVRLADSYSGIGGQGRQDIRGWADRSDAQSRPGFGGVFLLGGMGSANSVDARRNRRHGLESKASGHRERAFDGLVGDGIGLASAVDRTGQANGHWRDADWLGCRDGKWRSVEPGTFPLAHGLPARVGRLRGYGNAIVPQQAAEFVAAAMEAMGLKLQVEQAA